jgi:glycosyltransferase AglD
MNDKNNTIKKTYDISLFLPVYNCEPKKLQKNVEIILNCATLHYRTFEIIIVDDNSGKHTKDAINIVINNPNVRTISYTNGPSRRENLGASFASARFDIICYMDIDLSTDLRFLASLTDKVNEGYDIAVGSRYKGTRATREHIRRALSILYNSVVVVFFGSRVKDHTCGFKAFRKDVAVTLVHELGYDDSKKRGWFWDAEMLIHAQRASYAISEIPVEWQADDRSTFSLGRELRILPYMAFFWWRLRSTSLNSFLSRKNMVHAQRDKKGTHYPQ